MFTIASQKKNFPYNPINLFHKNNDNLNTNFSKPSLLNTSLLNTEITGKNSIVLNSTNPNSNSILIYSGCLISFCLGYLTHYYIKKKIN